MTENMKHRSFALIASKWLASRTCAILSSQGKGSLVHWIVRVAIGGGVTTPSDFRMVGPGRSPS